MVPRRKSASDSRERSLIIATQKSSLSLRYGIYLTASHTGKVVVDSLPENDEACGELLLELVDYLPKRYPTLFRRDGPDGITNLVTGEQYVSLGSKKGTDALVVISRCVLARSREHPPEADMRV